MTEKIKKGSKKDPALKSPWVWAILIMFGLIFTVNYGFISAALDTNPGLVTEQYYKYGLQQNKIDEQYRAQAARGWQVKLNFPEPWQVNQDALVSVTVKDRYGNPISGGIAEVTAYRPSDADADKTIQLKETNHQGIYQAHLQLPLKGSWDINLLFRKGDAKHMLNERIFAQGDKASNSTKLETIVDFVRQKSAK